MIYDYYKTYKKSYNLFKRLKPGDLIKTDVTICGKVVNYLILAKHNQFRLSILSSGPNHYLGTMTIIDYNKDFDQFDLDLKKSKRQTT